MWNVWMSVYEHTDMYNNRVKNKSVVRAPDVGKDKNNFLNHKNIYCMIGLCTFSTQRLINICVNIFICYCYLQSLHIAENL